MRALLTAGLVTASLALLAPAASAHLERRIDLLTNSGSTDEAQPLAFSQDGARVIFKTNEAIPGTGDSDAASDLYEWHDGTITLLSKDTNAGVDFRAASKDGSRVFFQTAENIAGTGDSDNTTDCYEAHAGNVTLLTGSGAAVIATCQGISDDGTKVFFASQEKLTADDQDAGSDVYRAQGGSITLMTGSGSAVSAIYAGNTPDGSRLFFNTAENIGTDTDNFGDVYRADSGGITRISNADPTTFTANFRAASTDGSVVYFNTQESIPGTGDADGAIDVYRADSGGITLASGNGANITAAYGGITPDGSQLFFESEENIAGTGDSDGVSDVYRYVQGSGISLVSNNGAAVEVTAFRGASPDGSRVVFETEESLPGTPDADGVADLYERTASGFRLLTGGATADPVSVERMSVDASRVLFSTAENMPGTGDADGARDLYLAEGGAITLLTGSGAASDVSSFIFASSDASRVIFTTAEQIPGTGDTDGGFDIYLAHTVDVPDPTAPSGGTPPADGSAAPQVGGGEPALDRIAPQLVLSAKAKLRLKTALKKGIPVTVSCDEACDIAISARLDARTAKKLGVGRFVARGSARVTAPGRVPVTLRVGRRAARKLARAKRLTLTVLATATDNAGNARDASKKVTLTR